MGQSLSSLDGEIQILFADLIFEAKFLNMSETALLLWQKFNEKKLTPIEMAPFLSANSGAVPHRAQKCKLLSRRITKLLIEYNQLALPLAGTPSQ